MVDILAPSEEVLNNIFKVTLSQYTLVNGCDRREIASTVLDECNKNIKIVTTNEDGTQEYIPEAKEVYFTLCDKLYDYILDSDELEEDVQSTYSDDSTDIVFWNKGDVCEGIVKTKEGEFDIKRTVRELLPIHLTVSIQYPKATKALMALQNIEKYKLQFEFLVFQEDRFLQNLVERMECFTVEWDL